MITIKINNIPTDLPNDYINLEELLELKGFNPSGTAVAVNNKIVKHENWALTTFKQGDTVVIISGAFGG